MEHNSPPADRVARIWRRVRDWLASAAHRVEVGFRVAVDRLEPGFGEALDRLVTRAELAAHRARRSAEHLAARAGVAAARLRDQAAVVGAGLADEARTTVVETGADLRAGATDLAAATRRGAAAAGRRARFVYVAGKRRLRPLRRRLAGLRAPRLPRLPRPPRPPRIRLHPLHGVAAGFVLLGVASGLYLNCGVRGCPDVTVLAAFQPGGGSMLLDRNGVHFADLAPVERAVVPLDSLPEHLSAAFLAIEDHRFYRHRGVDPVRVVGAALANLRSRSVHQGSSTVPMQLARSVFPERLPGAERTVKRKLQEVRVARLLEKRYSKDEILELYLNHIYFGGGAYGVEAAARLFFAKPAAKLTLAEAATLAALPKAPSHYDPRRHPDRTTQRRDLVLALMQRHGLTTPELAAEAVATELAVRADGRDRSGIPLGAWFVDVVRHQLEDRFGETLHRQRLVVHTTLDTVAQVVAERELSAQLTALDRRVRRGEGELQGAVVMLEAHTGDVLAMVGGRDPATSRYNRATKGLRQVGSAFKPFVFVAAIARGVPTSQLVLDTPLRMQLSRNDVWQPTNYDGRFEGQIPLRQALVRSRNVPTVRLASQVGIADVARTARLAGLRDPMDETPALALGTVATSPLRLAAAYSAFATLGRAAEPRFIVRVEDEHGRVLWEPPHTPPQAALDPAVAYVVTDILRDAVDYGTGTGVRHAGFRGPAAGKTGTTNRATDAWFVGFTPDVVGAVWIGYDRPSSLGPGATGGGFAAPVWGRIMRQVYGPGKRPAPGEWPVPPGIQYRRVDFSTGLALHDGCYSRSAYEGTEVFTSANLPETACPRRDFWLDFLDRFRRDRDRERRADGRAAPGRGW